MCVSAYVWRPGERPIRCGSVGELSIALRGPVLMEDGSPPDGRCCLCPVNMAATARLYGFRLIPPAYGRGTWHYDGWGLKDPSITRRYPERPKIPMKGEVAVFIKGGFPDA